MKDKKNILIIGFISFIVIILFTLNSVLLESSKNFNTNDCLSFVKTDGVFIDDGEVVVYNDFNIFGISDKTSKVRLIHGAKNLKTYELKLNNGESITVYGANLKAATDGSILEDGAHSIMCYVTISKIDNKYIYKIDYERTRQHDFVLFQWLLDNDGIFKSNFQNEKYAIWI